MFSIESLVILSLATATAATALLIWVLARINATFPGASNTTEPESTPTRWWHVSGPLAAVALTVFAVLVLFMVNIDHFNKLRIGRVSVLVCAVLGFGTGYVADRKLLRRLRPFHITMLGIAPIKEAVVITGTIFALFAGKIAALSLSKTTNSNMAAVYGQVYQNDFRTSERELLSPSLQGIYLHPSFIPDEKDATKTRDLKIGDFANEKAVQNVARLYWNARFRHYMRGLDEVPAGWQPPGDVPSALRWIEGTNVAEAKPARFAAAANSHVTAIFSNLHLVHDYASRGVIPPGDVDTWWGYFEDVGPHPLALTVLWNWLDREYMTYEFFVEAERRVSGKRKLQAFLNEHPSASSAALLAELTLNSPDKSRRHASRGIVRLEPAFYQALAATIEQHRGDLEVDEFDTLFTALAQLAVYNHYVVAQPGYAKRVSALVPDQNEREE